MEHVGFPRTLRVPAMPTLAQVYEQHSEECIRSAAKTDDPKQRALMLKLAGEWREDANVLRPGFETPGWAYSGGQL